MPSYRTASILLAALFVVFFTGGRADAQAFQYCSIKGAKRILVLLDQTTKFDAKDQQSLTEALDAIQKSLGPGDRLVIRTITDDFARSDSVFDRCKPGCPPQSFIEQLGGRCTDLMARRDNLIFMRTLAASLVPIVTEKKEYRASDILRTIHIVVGNFPEPPTRVVIFSDMIENSALGRFARSNDASMRTLLLSLQRQRLIPKLKAAVVEAFGFGRLDVSGRRGLSPAQMLTIRKFWESYFGAAGVKTFTLQEQLTR